MSRCRTGTLAVTLFLALSATLLFAPSSGAAPAKTQQKLNQAVSTLHSLNAELQTAGDALLVALAANDQTEISAQLDVIRQVRPQVSRLTLEAKKLRLVISHPMTPDASGSWMPVLRAAAKQYHLSVQALHRMMLLESGGRVKARGGGGQFLGLFQYCLGTWKAAWNPYRNYSVFHGGAQIWATAAAIHRGWGRSMWPNTYPMAFGGIGWVTRTSLRPGRRHQTCARGPHVCRTSTRSPGT